MSNVIFIVKFITNLDQHQIKHNTEDHIEVETGLHLKSFHDIFYSVMTSTKVTSAFSRQLQNYFTLFSLLQNLPLREICL